MFKITLWFSRTRDLEADLFEFGKVEDVTTIEDSGEVKCGRAGPLENPKLNIFPLMQKAIAEMRAQDVCANDDENLILRSNPLMKLKSPEMAAPHEPTFWASCRHWLLYSNHASKPIIWLVQTNVSSILSNN